MKNHDIVIDDVVKLIDARYCNGTNKIGLDSLNAPLLGEPFNLESRHLLELFFLIEKEFNIRISEEMLIKYKFDTINNITTIICNTLGGDC